MFNQHRLVPKEAYPHRPTLRGLVVTTQAPAAKDPSFYRLLRSSLRHDNCACITDNKTNLMRITTTVGRVGLCHITLPINIKY